MLLEGKIALVTGGSRGIGRAIAIRLAEEGAKVAVNYAGNQAAAEEVKSVIEAKGGTALLVQADVSDSTVAADMVTRVHEELGGLDILVNNAGITRDTLLMRMKDEDFDAVISTNLKGIYACTKAAAKFMTKWADCESFLCGRRDRQCGTDELCSRQGGCDRLLKGGGEGIRTARGDGQCGCPRIHRH